MFWKNKNKYWDEPDLSPLSALEKPLLIMMCGLPGSGKSCKAKTLSEKLDCIVFSSDQIRKELFGDENSQENNNKVFRILHERVIGALKAGQNVIFDATNLNSRKRSAFLRQIKKIDCYKFCYLIPTPYEDCIKNNKKRERQVPELVIKNMYKSFQVPYYNEGFDDIIVDWSVLKRDKWNGDKAIYKLRRIKHDNPHHKYTIGEHCMKAQSYAILNTTDMMVWRAALLHDVGKRFCKEFDDNKVAHYYGHESVSAYMSLAYMKQYASSRAHCTQEDILKVAFLINYHMRIMQLENLTNEEQKRRALSRMRRKLGDDLMNDLMLLREADEHGQR